jgi:hypothetical protein
VTVGTLGAAPIEFIGAPLYRCGKYTVVLEKYMDSRWFAAPGYDPSSPYTNIGVNVTYLPTDYKPVGTSDLEGVRHIRKNFSAPSDSYLEEDIVAQYDFFTDPESAFLMRGYDSGKFTEVYVYVGARQRASVPINGGAVKIHQNPPIGYLDKSGKWRELCLEATATTYKEGCLLIYIKQVECDPLQ